MGPRQPERRGCFGVVADEGIVDAAHATDRGAGQDDGVLVLGVIDDSVFVIAVNGPKYDPVTYDPTPMMTGPVRQHAAGRARSMWVSGILVGQDGRGG
jgi:hypothetical protein